MKACGQYVKVLGIVPVEGDVIVQDVHISREGLSIILLEDQIFNIRKRMTQRSRQLTQLQAEQVADQQAIDKLLQAVNQIRKSQLL